MNNLMRRGTTAASILLAATLLAACAAPSGSGIPDAGEPAPTQTAAAEPDAHAYAECMRENGVEMSDPDPTTGLPVLGDSVDPESATFEAAHDTCGDLLPGGIRGETDEHDLAAYLEFAACMRENGLPDFPDPQPGGEGGLFGDAGVDRTSPEFQSALEACGDILSGAGQ